MTAFETDTAVTRIGTGVYETEVSKNWWVVRGPHGGYLASIILRALMDAVGDPERAPRSLTVHYAAAPSAGPARIEVETVRAGSSLSTLSARMIQDDKAVAIALGAFSKEWGGLDYTDVELPDTVPPEEGFPVHEVDSVPEFVRRFNMMATLGDPPMSGSDTARLGGWIRMADPVIADAVVVATLMDAWMPVVFPVATEQIVAPTIDLTIHFRAPLPHPGATPEDHYFAVFWSHLARDGFFEEDGELWSKDGVLLAQSRQLALTLTPRG